MEKQRGTEKEKEKVEDREQEEAVV